MKINSYEDLLEIDSEWESTGDGPWDLTREGIDTAFGATRNRIGVYWIGYAEDGTLESFFVKYIGKAVDQTLPERLIQHITNSSNQKLREALARGAKLKFRFVETSTGDLANELEGLEISANREQLWNERNEWLQQWAWLEGYGRDPKNSVERLPEPEEEEQEQMPDSPVRRGPNRANPLRARTIEIFYGNGEGAGDAVSKINPIFVTHGMIFSNQSLLAAQRAWMRSSSQHLPQVFRGRVERLMFGRILDLRNARIRQQWSAFLQSRPESEGPTYGELLEQPNADIWQFFSTFLNRTGRNIENYDTIIRPELLRRGVQYCVRDPARAKSILEKLEELPEPLHIKLMAESGLVHEILIDPANPREMREALRFIAQRSRAESENLRTPRSNGGSIAGPFTYSPAQRVGAGALGALELINQAAEMYALYSSLPSRLEVNLNLTLRKSTFWAAFGVPSIILAVALSDKVSLHDGSKAKVGSVLNPAALAPKTLSELTDSDLRFFLAFVYNVDMPDEASSILDDTLCDFVQYMRFLAWGRVSRSILPPKSDGDLPLSRIRNWYVVTERPKTAGSIEFIEEYHSIDTVLLRIRAKISAKEDKTIPTRQYLVGADTSRVKNQELAVNQRILKFNDMAHATIFGTLPDILSPSQDDTYHIGLPNGWGTIEPRFHQVGPVNVGRPFLIDNALLVTGANAETNAFLAGAIAEKESTALISGQERAFIVPGSAEPKPIWIEAPLVYVEAKYIIPA